MHRRPTSATSLFLALLLLVSCARAEQPSASAAASLPACAPVETAVSPPAELPATFPLPAGTVLTLVQPSSTGPTVISGVVPLSLSDAVTHFRDQLPEAGFELGASDAEQDEAEAFFSGSGVEGRWKVHSILDCAEAVTLTLSIAPS